MSLVRLARAASAALVVLAGAVPSRAAAQSPPPPERAVRRDVPITNSIRRALAAGTRDSTGRPTAAYWQLRTDYTVRARLDTATSTLTGSERVVIRNASPDTLRQLVLRLDPNIFRPETPKAAPWVPAEATDGMVVTRMAVDGRAVRLEAPAGAAPAGQGARSLAAAAAAGARPAAEPVATGLRTTVARVALAAPVPPGASVALEVDWRHKLPGGPLGRGHRMTQRWADTLYQPTQWYPRVAVYDDLRGWDAELYLGPSEFYNNFGRWDVRLDVPAGWLVSGTGTLQNPAEVLTPQARARLARVLESDAVATIVAAEERGPGRATAAGTNGRLVWHFAADSVNDFAWATARSFVWRATRARSPRTPAARRRAACPSTCCTCPAARRCSTARARPRGTRSSSTRGSGSRTRSRSSPCRTGRARGWSTRWSSTATRARPTTRPGTSGGRWWWATTRRATAGWTRASTSS